MMLVVYLYNYRFLKPNIDQSESKEKQGKKVKSSSKKKKKNHIGKLNFIFTFC